MATPNKPAAAKKPTVPVYKRASEQLKRAAVAGKLSAEELDKLATLATSLKAFVEA